MKLYIYTLKKFTSLTTADCSIYVSAKDGAIASSITHFSSLPMLAITPEDHDCTTTSYYPDGFILTDTTVTLTATSPLPTRGTEA